VNAFPTPRRALRVGCAVVSLVGAAAIGQVQPPSRSTAPALQPAVPIGVAPASNRSVRVVPQPAAPTLAPGVAHTGAPSPTGLPSPLPHPAGLTSQFPAGLPSPVPSPAGVPSPTVPNLASPGMPPGSPPLDPIEVPQTTVMGAGGYGGVPGPLYSPGVGSGPYTALQIAQSFIGADVNRDGELTRAEAQRLTIMPYSFEEMDRNRDGILTRFEYEDAVR
jgi:hypothetical protein